MNVRSNRQSVILSVVVFLSGCSVMMVEMVGSRVIAPYVGNSVHVWTALISVILGSLSIGYTFGGKLADRYPSFSMLALLFIVSSFFVGSITFLESNSVPLFLSLSGDIRTQAILISLVLFAPMSIVLGMISPYAVRLSLHSLEKTGSTAGNLTALSTVGSIVGTILTGFYLLGSVGHAVVLIIVTVILLLSGVLVWTIQKKFPLWVVGSVLLSFTFSFYSNTLLHPLGMEVDTPYQRILIGESMFFGRPIRTLSTDFIGIQSAKFLDKDNDLVFPYLKFFRLSSYFVPNPERVLLIGGAGYSYPNDFLRRNPTSFMDVVEIDPGMTAIAKQWFSYPDSKNLSVFHEDGRMYVNRTKTTYDVIYFDAFGPMVSAPYHLLTREFFQKTKQQLSPRGVFVMNVISAQTGERQRMLTSVYRTLQEVFPTIKVYSASPEINPNDVQNIILFASPVANVSLSVPTDEITARMLSQEITVTVPTQTRILTDAFAPVEEYAMDLMKR